MITAGSLARTRAFTARRVSVAVAALGGLVAVSAVVRVAVAQRHTAPRYWPDEYVYATLSRSLAHGHLEVRGQPAHFYAILQPILAAPLWRFFPIHEAYRLIQVENAIAASLVVIPLWFLGRELKLARLTIYLVCVYALVVPTLALLPVTISDFIAYPLAIAAIAVAVRSLNEPTRARQMAFLCFAALATLARIQYFVLIPAYLAAAFVLDRRRAHRTHSWVFLAVLPAVGGAILAVTGYYEIGAGSFRLSMLNWMALQAFLLSVTAGVAIVPGAVAALLRPNGRTEKAFAVFAGVFIVLVLAEASQPAAVEGRYKERYLLTIVPILAIAFGMYLRGRRPSRLIVLAVGAALVIAAARLPFSSYTFNAPHYDSETLNAAWLLQLHLGASTSSLVFALFITVAAIVAMAATWRAGISGVALPLSIAFMAVVTVVAIHIDVVLNQPANDPAWINRAAGTNHVTAIATPASARLALVRQLYWNDSINRELLLESATPTDTYATTEVKLGPDGELEGVHGYFLFDRSGTQARFGGVTTKASKSNYVLLEGRRPRLRVLVENQLATGWLSPATRLRAWRGGAKGLPVVRFTLSLPPEGTRVVHMRLGRQTFVVRAGSALHLTCRATRWPFKLIMLSNDIAADSLGRPVTVGLTKLAVSSGPAPAAAGCTAATR